MNIAIVGCGFLADYYLTTLPGYPVLELIGVMDRDPDRAARFAQFHHVHKFASLDDLLSDERVELVLNLTNPRSHYEVSKACLDAGKHVYSEKPLATALDQAKSLVELASSRGLPPSAPCSLLGIRIHDPFYTPHRMSRTWCEERTGKTPPSDVTPLGWKKRLRRHPLICRGFETIVRPAVRAIRGGGEETRLKFPPGDGYQFEAAEVMRRPAPASSKARSCPSPNPYRS